MLKTNRRSTKLFYFMFCQLAGHKHKYRHLLNDHIIKILKSKPLQFEACQQKFQQLIRMHAKSSQFIGDGLTKDIADSKMGIIKPKFNMIFRIYSLPQVMDRYKDELSQMVIHDQIKNQSQVDRIISIAMKNVKINKNFVLKQLIKFNNEQQNDRHNFQKILQQYANKKEMVKIPQVSKILRQKFISIQSKQIYQRLKQINQAVQQQNKLPKTNATKQKQSNQFWDKILSIKPRLLSLECNDSEVYKKHLQVTQNRLRFRFPPEPNGYLHIGHVKSIRINFETAKRHNGVCYLRYDDTNPQTQSKEYIDQILENVRWLGYEPDKITYASDYFQEMLQFAINLIKEGHAYVCDSPQSQIQQQRKQKLPSRYRNRSIAQSLSMFPCLSQGQTLRLKLDPSSPNPTLRDPVIYRLKTSHPHPRTGTKYKVYPIYDFAHCICDSLQDIDFSLCSLQFQVRRELYYKILDLLGLYKPIVWQYSRLNVEGAVVSKRKIKALIQTKAIQNWSDPRLLTIGGLRNRGYVPDMLINFIDKVNASRAGNQNIVQFSLLERQMKKFLFKTAEKCMMILQPRQLQIRNWQQIKQKTLQIQLYTDQIRKQTRKIAVSKKVYIQKTDEIQIGVLLVLKYLGIFKILQKSQNTILIQKIDTNLQKIKKQNDKYKILHWISKQDSHPLNTIIFDRLLNQQDKVNQNSKIVYEHALVPKTVIENRKNTEKYWQMERLGYFKWDFDGNFIRCASLH